MTKRLPILLFALAAPFLATTSLMGQSVMQVSVAVNGTTSVVGNGGSVFIAATELGQPVLATVTVRYTGTASAVVTGVTVTGTTEMALSVPPAVPITLNPNGSTTFTVQYLPTSGNSVFSQVSVAFTENAQPSAFLFNLTGASPRLAFSYYFAPAGSLTDLNTGDRVTFPSTNVGSSSLATFTVFNRGTAAGTIQGVTSTSNAFQLTGGAGPIRVQPGQQASFNVTFAPQSAGVSQGLLTFGFTGGAVSFALVGTGTSSALSVSYTLGDGNVRPISSGTLISLPSVDINSSSSAGITILNQGTGAGTVTAISISGAGFQLSGVPLLPATVPAGQSLRFNIVFAPTQPGTFSGTFSITMNGATITGALAGSTSTPNFTAAYSLGNAASNPLTTGTIITFPAVDVNGTATASVTLLNQGAGAGVVSTIAISGAGFQLTGTPVLPATVTAGQSLRFNIVFSPPQAGTFSATFTIALNGNTIFGYLSGSTTTPTFAVSYAFSDATVHPLSSGATITFPAIDFNATGTATITIANQGLGAGTVTGIAASGSAFQIAGVPALPATVPAGQSLRFSIVFSPPQSGNFSGTFRIDLAGNSISGTLTGTTAASKITLAYIDPDTNNVIPLSGNSTLPFPNTLSGTVSNLSIVATNSGAGTGLINSVTLGSGSPSAFQVTNLPALPVSVAPSQQARFGVRFAPQQQQSFSGTLLVSINGQITTINLAGQGTGPQYTYSTLNGSGTSSLLPGATLTIADTTVGQTSTVTISIVNAGTGDGQISGVSVTGQGLSLSGVPAGPFTLHPTGSQQVVLTFAPPQPGSVKGQLTIGGDTFSIAAMGIGSKLTFTYTNTAATNPVTEGGVILFPPSAVGSSQNLTLSIQNTGTSATTISSINLVATSTVFALQQLPGLPMNLNPGATIKFAASFLPNNTGTTTATLAVNTSTFTLSGNGTAPAALPSYQFQGPSGNPQPAQQTGIGLSLLSPYPLPLRGVLSLTFASSVFIDDPAIQFANGARTVSFTIPANTTQALFNGTATTVPLQTGTTAGMVTITPSFAMQSGFDMTPASPAALNLTVQRVAPQLLSATVTGTTLNTFTLNVSGYSTGRNLRQFDIQITPRQGATLSSGHLTIDVNSASSVWFQNPASQAFGGTFQVAIPFILQNGSTTDDLVHMLQSLSITATNDVGASSAVSVSIP